LSIGFKQPLVDSLALRRLDNVILKPDNGERA
jgi:hypothetical protein